MSSQSARPDGPEAKAWLAAVIESSDDAIITKTLQSIVTTWNRAAERIFGYTADEMVGQSILTIIPTDRAQEEPMIIDRLRRGERVDHFETVRRCKDGSLVNVSVTISPVLNEAGDIVGVSKIARDITAQKRFEWELKAAREAAESANRAKDRFLSVLSHELRTPLTPALGAISILERNQDLSASVREQLTMVRHSIETEARLVDDLLDITRIARGKIILQIESIDAHAVIRAVVKMFQREADEKQIRLDVSLFAKGDHVWADAGRFQQILLNLMSNALKFTAEGGTVRISTRDEQGVLCIIVEDNGVGIIAEVMPRLFSAFEQGELTVIRRFGGLGLGLSIVKSLAELHKGSITAESAGIDKGARFVLRMPLAPLTQSHDKAANVGSSGVTQSWRILLVEDHDDTRHIMEILAPELGVLRRRVAERR